jgi:ParB family chromosome partitioning protein
VAARFGVSPLFVRQRLKLANVAPRFIKAYRAEEIRLDQLEALAITDDRQAQEKVWDSLRHDWERSPHNLRSLLTEKHVSVSAMRIADGEFLDYLNACARLRTQRVKVELLVELSPL